jgi:hypothetical protein
VERRQSQEFRNLCVKFDEKEGGGVGNDVRRKPESNPSRGLNCKCDRPFAWTKSGEGGTEKINIQANKIIF